MRYKRTTTLAVGLTIQHTCATAWTGAAPFSCPNNTDTQCSPAQQAGYDWSGLTQGGFSSYKSNVFTGFGYSPSFGKRDVSNAHRFQSGAITAKLADSPSMSCATNDWFTIDRMEVSSSHDAEILCHYNMADGSTCTDTHTSLRGGSIFQNAQCGGATSVTFKPGKDAPSDCSFAVHSIRFHCGAPSTTMSTTMSTSTTNSHLHLHSSTCHGGHCTATTPSTSGDSTAAYSSSTSANLGCSGQACSSTPPWQHITPSKYTSGQYCYLSTCVTSGTSTVAYGTTAIYSAATARATSGRSAYPSPQCPTLLPRCLNTWMFMESCKDNSDVDCFCPKAQYIKNVMGCIGAWSTSTSEVESAASYLMGICASYVAANPAIVTACPVPMQPAKSAVAHMSGKSGGDTIPWTTISLSTTMIVAAMQSTGISAGLTVPGSSHTTTLVTAVTVPWIQFGTRTITVTGFTTASVVTDTSTLRRGPVKTTATSYISSADSTAGAPVTAGSRTANFNNPSGTAFRPTPISGSPPKTTGLPSPIVPATGGGGNMYSRPRGLLVAVTCFALALL